MLKGLDYANDYSAVKYMDTSTSLELLVTADGAPFDLSACQSVTVTIANSDGYIMSRDIDVSALDDPTTGLVTLPIDSGIMAELTPDDYRIEVWCVIKPVSVKTTSRTATLSIIDNQLESHTAIFPSEQDSLGFTIKENLMSNDGEVVAMVTLTEFENRFDQLKTDLTNKVATLQGPKGDTGLTGPQGPQGIQGIKGDTGPIGPQGPQGERGKQIFKSSYEDAPNSSTNYWSDLSPAVSVDNPPKIGDTIITPSGNIFQIDVVTVGGGGGGGVFGVGDVLGNIRGIQGIKGDTGQGLEIKGKVDTTSQLPATASEGDGYLVGEELYVRVNNAWKDCGQIQGPAGKDGKDGATGPQGLQGPKGDTGAIGPRGPQGIQGPKGDTGATGATGPAGKDGTQVDLTEYAKTTDMKTAINTATANMVDSSKPTNFTAGLKSGGVDVATAADLKSIEDASWRQLDFGSDANLGGALVSSYIVYQIHADEKYLSFLFFGVPQLQLQRRFKKSYTDGFVVDC